MVEEVSFRKNKGEKKSTPQRIDQGDTLGLVEFIGGFKSGGAPFMKKAECLEESL